MIFIKTYFKFKTRPQAILFQMLHECTEMEIRFRAPSSEGRVATDIRHTPYRKGNNRVSLYKFFITKVHITGPHRAMPYVPRGLYKNLFLSTYVVVLTALHEHILSHFVISYSLFVISLFNTYLSMCVPILWYVFSYSLFIMTLYIFSTITYQYSS